MAPGEDEWALAQGIVAGHRTICRWRTGIEPDSRRPVRITVKVGLSDVRDDGLPGVREFDVLDDIERTLDDELRAHGAELVLVVTGNRAREFIAYGAGHEWLQQWGPTVLARWADGRPGTGVEAELDPGWDTFTALTVSPPRPKSRWRRGRRRR